MTSLPKFSVDNPVLVNMLMVAIICAGVYSGVTLVREMFPESRPDQVLITTPYPGATPTEVEKGISIRLEEAIKEVDGIDKIETEAAEGLSAIVVTMDSDVDDIDQAVNDFKAAVDAVPRADLPSDAEETRVMKFEPWLPVISVALYGDVDEDALKAAGQDLRDEILLLPGITEVKIRGTRKDEITVEVPPEKLIEYRLSLSQVAEAIRQTNLDLPGGQLKTSDQNVAVRTLGETDDAEQIENTVVITTPTGEVVRVRDLGGVIDGFEDSDVLGRINGRRAIDVTIYKTAEQDAIDIAGKVKAFVAGKNGEPLERTFIGSIKHHMGLHTELDKIWQRSANDPYPPELVIKTHGNLARFIEGRLELLQRNGLMGLVFVFLSLLVFLNWRVSFWVMMGLIVSVCGAILLMNWVGATLNLISMFGLIVVLGLIVDDAIVVGENVYARIERGDSPRLAAIKGAEEVTWPVIVAVCTTIGAFLPLMFIDGQIGDFMGVLPVVVTCALFVSLIESLSILPCHLGESLRPVRTEIAEHTRSSGRRGLLFSWRERQRRFVNETLSRRYERFLRLAAEYRYVTFATVCGCLLIIVGLIAGGRVPFVFLQKMDAESIICSIEMPVGSPVERTEDRLMKIEQAIQELPEHEVDTIWTLVGGRLDVGERGATPNNKSHLGQIIIELATVEERDRTSEQVIADLRAKTSSISGINAIKYQTVQGGPSGAEIELEVTGNRMEDLIAAANALKSDLATFTGVYDIDDDFEAGRRELQIELLDSARPLNLTTQMLATEVRGAFYGLEARTLQRPKEDVDIRVRFPEADRTRIHTLESMRIRTPGGRMVPLSEVARVTEGRGYTSLKRVNQKRAVVITADVDQSEANSEEILAALRGPVDQIMHDYPSVTIEFAGNKRETTKSLSSLRRDFLIAILVIFVMLAGLFKSYVQPLIVLTAIPFGLIGAVGGHYVMGYPMTILSVIGTVALTGIVVNDALILVSFVNKEIASGQSIFEAVIAGGKRRLRPILLTSLTTILGLAPLMAEQSFQARFLIPMAISISFGLAFATILTLIVVPAIYLIVEDARWLARWAWYGPSDSEDPIGDPIARFLGRSRPVTRQDRD